MPWFVPIGSAASALAVFSAWPLAARWWRDASPRRRTMAALSGFGALAVVSGASALLAAVSAGIALLMRRRGEATLRRRCFADLPEFFELLGLCLSSGPSLATAWSSTVRSAPSGPLKQELERATRALELGRPAADVMSELASAIGDARASMALALVAQAMSRGNPLEPVLLAQASALRRLRMMEIERRAQTAPLRMMAPVFLFIFPAVLLLLLAPVLLKIASGGPLF